MTGAEEWRPIAAAPGYEVSDRGRVRTLRRNPAGVLMTLWLNRYGYPCVHLNPHESRITRRVHQLVAEAFLGPRPVGTEVRHLDGSRDNNVPSNLSYGTHSENLSDAVAHGTHNMARKTHCPVGHPYDEANTLVNKKGHRECRTCRRKANRLHMRRIRRQESA